MSLVLGAGAFCNWDKALPVLTALEFNEGQARAVGTRLAQALENHHSAAVEDVAGLQLLSEELDKHPNQHVILLYSNLADVLLHTINVEQSVADSLKEWEHSLTALQDFYRKHRKQTLLFNLQEVLEQPQLFLAVCAKEWGCAVDDSDISVEANKVESWSQLLANEILDNDDKLNHTLQHTKAMTWPLGVTEEIESVDKSGLLDLLRQLQSYAAAERALAQQQISNTKLTEENQLILDKLCLVQEELEKQVLTLRSEQAELNTLRESYAQLESEKGKLNATVIDSQTQFKKSRSEIDLLRKENKDLSEENQLILDKLFLTQEELEKQFKKSPIEIELLQKDNKNLAEENQLILDELHLIQKELEKQLIKLESERLELKNANTHIELLQKDKEVLTKESNSASEQLLMIENELEKQIREVKMRYSLN